MITEKTGLYENVFVDLTDLLSYCAHSCTFTGIQRVTAEITQVLLRESAHALVFDDAAGIWMQVDSHLVLQLYDAMATSSINGGVTVELQHLHQELILRRQPHFRMNAILISFGANWGSHRILGSIRAIKRQTPLTYVCFVHDVVPLKMPELCDQNTVRHFRRWIASSLVNADIIVTSSRINASELGRVSDTLALPSVSPVLCGLGADTQRQTSPKIQPINPRVEAVLKQPFVLFVGTIEPRKDHLFVLFAWKLLIERLGAEQAPLLILVGKLGWRYEPVIWALEGDQLHGRAVLMSDASDHVLEQLYYGALFTVYNSIYEGWGLPVSESLSRGKVPLIPAHSGLLESGKKGAVFFEPGSQADFVTKAIRLIRDPDFRRQKTDALIAQRDGKTWSDVAHRLLADIMHRITGPSRSIKAAITAGTIYKFTDNPNLQGLAKFAQSEALLEAGWYYLEDWGAWSSANDVTIAGWLKEGERPPNQELTGSSEQEGFRITIALLNVYDQRKLSIFQGEVASTLDIELPLGRTVVQVPISLDKGLNFRLVLRQSILTNLADHTDNWDRREIGFGIEAIMVCRDSDIRARLDFLEFQTGYRKSDRDQSSIPR